MLRSWNVKRTALAGCKAAGLFRATLLSEWRRKRVLILCYHGVSLDDEHEWKPKLYVTQGLLERRLRRLKNEGYHILSLERAIRALYAKDLPERSIVVTFDDGGYDFYKCAYPVLSSYGIPSTVYLTSYYCSRNWPVFDQICSYLLWKKRDGVLCFPEVLGGREGRGLRNAEQRLRVWKELVGYAGREGLSAAARNELAAELARRLNVDFAELIRGRIVQLMNPKEVGELASAGVDFQLHTHRHRVPRNRELFEREIEENRQCIRQMTGAVPVHFCYPSGVVDPMFVPWLRQLGIASGTTCEAGCASDAQDPLLLPRFQDSSLVSDIEFEGWITGFIPLGKRLSKG
jgi:peptidoglycan/xylan/chitin deacetylase (PgdA/CDA1 family)